MPADRSRGPQPAPSGWPSMRVAAGVAAAIVLLDQATKALVEEHIPLHASISLIDGLLGLTHIRNTGVAFGMLNTIDIPFKAALTTGLAVVALLFIAAYAVQTAPRATAARLGLTLVIGGAAGNLIDRATAGYVVDFVDVYWGGWHFWAFNVADSAITVGASCFLFDLLFADPHVSEAA